MTRKSTFSYQCHACNKCCHGKGIQVNPYESMRLASAIGVTTTEFIQMYLSDQMLKHKPDSNACIFLGEKGCTVHEHRPLACRLYPLGRLRKADGQELFTELIPHPKSAGEYGNSSTITDYLETQKVTTYLQAERQYIEVVAYMAQTAFEKIELDSDSKEQQREKSKSNLNYANWILDPDLVIAKYCKLKNLKFPSDIEQKLILHLNALRAWADGEWEPDIDNNKV